LSILGITDVAHTALLETGDAVWAMHTSEPYKPEAEKLFSIGLPRLLYNDLFTTKSEYREILTERDNLELRYEKEARDGRKAAAYGRTLIGTLHGRIRAAIAANAPGADDLALMLQLGKGAGTSNAATRKKLDDLSKQLRQLDASALFLPPGFVEDMEATAARIPKESDEAVVVRVERDIDSKRLMALNAKLDGLLNQIATRGDAWFDQTNERLTGLDFQALRAAAASAQPDDEDGVEDPDGAEEPTAADPAKPDDGAPGF
jgi:hypothetical protein